MAPSATQQVLLSPAELSYLYTSLSLSPPIRSDGRGPSQFRALVAETGVLPGTNGSARICFADGTEAIVGVKAEVEKSWPNHHVLDHMNVGSNIFTKKEDTMAIEKKVMNEWVDVDIEIPGIRDDDSMPVFMAAILKEALLTDAEFVKKLWINYRLKSEEDEDPLFDDDWEASVFLYPRENRRFNRPPITLLVMAVKDNIIFDPTKEELAVAEVVLAVSVGESPIDQGSLNPDSGKDLTLLAARTIDPPSRPTYPGLPDALNTATGGGATTCEEASLRRENVEEEGVWQPPRGGIKRKLIATMIQQVLIAGGVTGEVMDGLDAVEVS